MSTRACTRRLHTARCAREALEVRAIPPIVLVVFRHLLGGHACASARLEPQKRCPISLRAGVGLRCGCRLTTARAVTASAKGSKKEKKEEPSDERVRVVVRIRPPIRKDEMYGEGSEALQVDKERNLLFLLQKEGQGVTEKTKQFVFDRVLWKDSEQVTAEAHHGL